MQLCNARVQALHHNTAFRQVFYFTNDSDDIYPTLNIK